MPFAAPPEGDGEPLLEAVSSGPSAETGEETASPSESEESPEEDMFEDVVLEEKQTGSMIVAAKTPQSGMETAVETLREMYKSTGVKRPVIKINAGKLNDKGLHTVRERIAAKDLIIEDFCLLNGSNIKELLGMLRSDSLDTTFVLIDVQANIRRLVDAHPSFERLCHVIGEMSPKEEAGETETRQGEDLPLLSATETGTPDVAASFAEAFSEPKQEEAAAVPGEAVREEADRTEEDPFATKRFSLQKEERPVREVKPERPASTLSPSEAQDEDGEILSLDDFAQYASEYAMSIDCSLTGKTMLALYERIEIMDEEGVPLTKQNAVNLIEEAADRAEKPPLMKRMFQKKYDKDGKLILKEEHFIS